MIGQREALRMFGCEVFDPAGHRMGIVGQLFVDEDTEQPAWVTVQTGLFGTNESFVPLAGAAFDGDTLTVAVDREAVRLAPRVLLDQGDLPPAQERALYLHYGLVPDGTADDLGPEHAEAARLRLRRWVAAT
ncbi:PRC-barrel domain-containing protein [Saccharopolyspora antimicrobica]|uniref:PRC-barrel domain protein n=1 Tax=Saccharopolyspora antimicrobica TaxID=455193 RepID=A0A1I5JNZ4_9PSEU|nr:PRC-barrel domain-containing protein [Saccharopolyspora antimicrobica]RKT84713.1 PRC-barrel domain protein [Saccharopolyspora antimicrobica]SFO74449.1 PRC-barrel domain-containing protein [Saccharopolyspora antimicrobica]